MNPRNGALLLCIAFSWVFTMSCENSRKTAADFDKLTSDFVYGTLALSPSSATQAGYHSHNGVALDGLLDDYSPAGIQASRDFYTELQSRVWLCSIRKRSTRNKPPTPRS